jgi:hypothetical protein
MDSADQLREGQGMEMSESLAFCPSPHRIGFEADQLSELDPGQSLSPQAVHIAGAALKEGTHVLGGPKLGWCLVGRDLRVCAHCSGGDVNGCRCLHCHPTLSDGQCMTGYDYRVATICHSLRGLEMQHWQTSEYNGKQLQGNDLQSHTHNLKVVGSNPTPATNFYSMTYAAFRLRFLLPKLTCMTAA